MVEDASTDSQRSFVTKIILAHFDLFALQVFQVEVVIRVALLLDIWGRFDSLLGAAIVVNLSQGLYRSPSEWPWQYVFSSLSWFSSSLSRPDAALAWTYSWPSGTAVTSVRYLVCYDGCVKARKSTLMGDCDLASHDCLAP